MVEIISNIIKKLKETAYSTFRDADMSKEDAKEYAEETISDAIHSFTNYASSVAHMLRMVQIWTVTSQYEGQEFRDKVEGLDRRRRSAHDAAIANLSMLNRICDMLGIEKFTVDLNDRYAVGDWIGMFCTELFQLDNCHSMDDYMKLTNYKEYTDEEVNEAIKKIIA